MLGTVATSSLPVWLTAPMLTILTAVIVGRVAVVRERQVDRQTTWLLFWWLCAALLREGWLQSRVVDATPLTLSDLRLLTHAAAMLGAGALFLVVRALGSVRRLRSGAVAAVYALIVVEVAAMAWLSLPAREAGVAVEELHDWRTAVYLVVYSAHMPVAIAFAAVTCIHVFYRGDQLRSTRFWAALVLVAGLVSAFDHLTRMVYGVLLGLDRSNVFTDWRSESNDVLFLPAATLAALTVCVPVAVALRARLSGDPSAAVVVRLTPLWKDLSAALPAVSLQSATSALPSSVEREHRMRIECEDALYALLAHMPPEDRAENMDPVVRCGAVTRALEHRLAGDEPARPATTPTWLADEDELLRIADAWSRRPVTVGLV
ncbi:DUF6545 domain-containing protein [Rhodococcus gannanensis]|uniref:DUF6545 domain-containing protein n=2 Tax=Rhodococcus gannanensis TaxID=1960308 RepID=A0ABW4P253_9NOCA